jgi:hypothetical protein
MGLDYYQCEVCGAGLMFRNETNANKFPAARRFRDDSSEKDLLSVRCSECANLPYRLEEGQPFRADLLVKSEDVNILHNFNSDYNYWPHGFGHLLEVYGISPLDEVVNIVRSAPISIGFLVEEAADLIVVAYRLENIGWNVTPYQWHACKKWECAIPSDSPVSESEREFTVALVDSRGGKYGAIRKGVMPIDFATAFHRAINEQIAKGAPDWQRTQARVEHLYEWLDEKKLLPALRAQCLI